VLFRSPYLAEGVLDSDPGKLLAIRLSIRPEERRRADYALRSTAVLPDRLLVHFLKHERTGNVSIGSAHYPCSVVQLVEGLTLEQLLQELTAPLTLPEAESLLGNLLRAVKDFSAVFQMPHGDLNPGNVMIQSLPSRLEGATSCNRFDLIKIIDYIDCRQPGQGVFEILCR
jgi:serine/threonine protein kinase